MFCTGRCKERFGAWVVAAGLREVIEAVGLYLETVRTCLAVFRLFGEHESVNGRTWNAFRGSDRTKAEKFHRMGFPNKIEAIAEECPEGIDLRLAEMVLSINKARNCMVHRGGVVSKADAKEGDGMPVTWQRWDVVCKGADRERRIGIPGVVEPGESVWVKANAETRLFRVGETMAFSVQDFVFVCLTLHGFAAVLRDGLSNYAKTHRIPLDDGCPRRNESGP